MTWVRRTFDLLGSFGLACVILILLLVLTFFGTLDQQYLSLYEVRQKYFESSVVFVAPGMALDALGLHMESLRDARVPLPGGLAVLSLLFVNLLVGGMLRMRWSLSRLGILVIHFGIALMLLGSLVEFQTSNKGNMLVFEGQSSAQFESYDEWEVVVREPREGGGSREHVIPYELLEKARGNSTVLMTSDELPFDVRLGGYLYNCEPVPSSAPGMGVDGFLLEEKPREMQAERDLAGVTVTLEGLEGGPRTGLLWGVQQAPWTVAVEGKAWAVDLRKRTWPLPFSVYLKEFTREVHPGTDTPSKFYSDVTCVQNNVSQDVHISMNEPLRRDGFILFQSGFLPGDRASIFAVVENPADQVPLISLIIIALGLLTNFLPKLAKHVVRSARVAA